MIASKPLVSSNDPVLEVVDTSNQAFTALRSTDIILGLVTNPSLTDSESIPLNPIKPWSQLRVIKSRYYNWDYLQ
ncbi:unnamed protein product, partial [Allacma fusca]